MGEKGNLHSLVSLGWKKPLQKSELSGLALWSWARSTKEGDNVKKTYFANRQAHTHERATALLFIHAFRQQVIKMQKQTGMEEDPI